LARRFSTLRLSHVLIAGFGLLLSLLLLVSGLSIWSLDHVVTRMRNTAQTQAERLDLLRSMRDQASTVYASLLGAVISGPDDLEYEVGRFSKARDEYERLLAELGRQLREDGHPNAETEKAFALAESSAHQVYSMSTPLLERIKQDPDGLNRRPLASIITNTIAGHSGNWQAAIQTLTAQQGELGVTANRAADEEVSSTSLKTLAIAALALLVGIATTLSISRGVGRSIRGAVAFAQSVASGDLNASPPKSQGAEARQLFQALVDMQGELRRLVSDIRACAMSIEAASDEVARGNVDLSNRTEQAASRLQQTTALMETLATTIQHNTTSAASASTLASQASSMAVEGGEVMRQVIQNMADIADSSREIADIIAMIDGIAFRTNILALNAAVEAANAGPQGRGFSAVAAEVRSLSRSVADAAKQVKQLIEKSVDRVENGKTRVDQGGSAIGKIVDAVRNVGTINAEISDASQRQSEAIASMNQAVSLVETMTQQNAALVEQSAAAAESLKGQAQTLAQLVMVFRVDEASARP
jgi:methyl-accepting chemotaxis protein